VHGKYTSFNDGSIAKKTVIVEEQIKLRIALYNDDWTAVNPLGMYARNHKISAFYFTILNLPREYRSNQQGIWLVALCNSKTVKECGINNIMQPIVSDLALLSEKGVHVEALNQSIYATLTCVCADNLAGSNLLHIIKWNS